MDEIKCPRCGQAVTRRDVALGCCPGCGRMFPEDLAVAVWGERPRREAIFISYPGQARHVLVAVFSGVFGLSASFGGVSAALNWSAATGACIATMGAAMTAAAVLCGWATLTRGWPFRIGDSFMVGLRQVLYAVLMVQLGLVITLIPQDYVFSATRVPVAWFGYVLVAVGAVVMCRVLVRLCVRADARDKT